MSPITWVLVATFAANVCIVMSSATDRVTTIGETNGKIILVSKDEYPFSMVTDFCKAAGGVPLAIESTEEQTQVEDYMAKNDLTDCIWLGATREALPYDYSGTWFYWLKNVRYINREGGYRNWANGQPGGKDEECLCISPSFSYQWGDEVCNKMLRVLCEINFAVLA